MTTATTDDGVRIRVEADAPSSLPPLLFSNSLGTNMSMWDAQVEAARKHFRVILYDSRGHGRSDAPKGPYSIERLGRDALAVLDHLGIAKTNFCGLSIGGMVGMWIATHAPDRIDRLVLANTTTRIPVPDNLIKRAAAVRASGLAAIADQVLPIWFSPEFVRRGGSALEHVRSGILATPPEGYAATCEALAAMNQDESIRAIKAPTLIIVGSKDPSAPSDGGQAMHEKIAGSKLVMLEAAHLSSIETPAAFNEVVFGFLAG